VFSRFSRAQRLARRGKPRESLALLDEAIKARAACAPLHIHRALVFAELGRAGEAVEAARTAAEIAPENPACHVFLALTLVDANELEDAAAAVEKGLALDMENHLLKAAEALVLLKQGRLSQAAETLAGSPALDHAGLLVRLAPALEREALVKKHTAKKVEAELARVAKRKKKKKSTARGAPGTPRVSKTLLVTPEASLARGKRLLYREKYSAAAEHLSVASDLASALSGAALFLAGKTSDARGRLKQTAESARLGRLPATDEVICAIECYGEILFDSCDLSGARDVFEDAARLAGIEAEGPPGYFLGILALLSGRADEGRAALASVLDADPNAAAGRIGRLIQGFRK
jgi:tetratricopeptide (TPR) repeat protein